MSKGIDCDFMEKSQKATDDLLSLLIEHHDYSVRHRYGNRPKLVKIIARDRLTVDAIKKVVCEHFGVAHEDMISARRNREVQRPRAVAMYLAREFTSHGFPPLGRFFDRDHTSVLHSVRVMEEKIRANTDPIVKDVEYLREVLSA
ncbi:chromosomal replication initiation ATPase DnaA [Bradyrhizobium sp. AZCC 1578]|uniref:helix-turn-helix domain-containing protein n=1 Tax=Bradyrhizobium sp. AZCC 1578 TaxID=3117027 RepID=UPI002FEEB0AA